jgi:hypothetical protein
VRTSAFSLNANGGLNILSAGVVVGTISAPIVADGAGAIAPTGSFHWSLAPEGAGASRMTLAYDMGWLGDPARAFPVVIDLAAAPTHHDAPVGPARAHELLTAQAARDQASQRVAPGDLARPLLASGRVQPSFQKGVLVLGDQLGNVDL